MNGKIKKAALGGLVALALMFGIVWGDLSHTAQTSGSVAVASSGVVWGGHNVSGIVWGD